MADLATKVRELFKTQKTKTAEKRQDVTFQLQQNEGDVATVRGYNIYYILEASEGIIVALDSLGSIEEIPHKDRTQDQLDEALELQNEIFHHADTLGLDY